MNWLYYLLEANLYLLIFYGFYRLLLQHQTFYNSNRYYLLLGSLTAFVLPILQIGYLKPAPVLLNEVIVTDAPEVQPSTLIDYLYPIYIAIALCFAVKLLLGISKIVRLWLSSKKHRNNNFTLVELKEEAEAFSFFNLLFIHPQLAEKQVVLKHELVHIKQKHSVDVLFFEVLQIICWFNPVIYFIKKDIKLLHEYIADELSTHSNQQKHEYVMFLIENSFGIMPKNLTHQIFNQSILKRRINMLNKKRTTNWARLRLLLALPLGGAMLCTSTMAFTKDYGYVDLFPEKNKAIATLVQEVPKVQEVKQEPKTKKDQVKFPPPIVKADKKAPKAPPAVEVVKFPPPVIKKKTAPGTAPAPLSKVKTDKKLLTPPAVEPPPPTVKKVRFAPPKAKKDQVKFPPPIVKPDKKKDVEEITLKEKTDALTSATVAGNEKGVVAVYEKALKENLTAKNQNKANVDAYELKEGQADQIKTVYLKALESATKNSTKPINLKTKGKPQEAINLKLLPTKKQP